MVKQVPAPRHQSEEQAENAESRKKPLTQFLPYDRYINVKIKTYKKKLSEAIKHITMDKLQVKKAVECLTVYAEQHRNPTDLSAKQEYIYVVVQVSRIPEQHSVRPIQVALPHPIYSAENKTRYTIIASDENEEKLLETVDQLEVPMLREVLSYQKIRKNYKALADKRALLAGNDLFFCDWKVYNLLRQPLGKLFYQTKKFPYPIDCEQVPAHLKQKYSSYESYINGLADYTYTMLGNGPVYTIKAGRVTMNKRQLVKNIIHAGYGLVAHILDAGIKPEHIRQIEIKTYNSPSLPVYNYISQEEVQAYSGK